MAFDAIKKMAEGVSDYLEVPVTEDGLLEKATAAIHALGYDMEEAISIFLRRIVQTESAADPAQAEEYVRRTADTTLDDVVNQGLQRTESIPLHHIPLVPRIRRGFLKRTR